MDSYDDYWTWTLFKKVTMPTLIELDDLKIRDPFRNPCCVFVEQNNRLNSDIVLADCKETFYQ